MTPRQLQPAVLRALREGKRLCSVCMGQTMVRNVAVPDFEGDKEHRWMPCRACGGTGLERRGL